MADDVALEVHGVVARYGERTILKGVDLTVKRGEVRYSTSWRWRVGANWYVACRNTLDS